MSAPAPTLVARRVPPAARVAVVAGLAAAVVAFVAVAWFGGDARWVPHAGGDFVDSSSRLAHERMSGTGYDGQFMYRLAVSPLSDAARVDGVAFDAPAYRSQRVVYPAVAWIVSGGDPGRVPSALIVVNVLAVAAVGWFGALLAEQAGVSPWAGLTFAAYPGFVLSLGLGLGEIVASAFLLGGIWAARAGRSWTAGLLLLGAVMSREATAVVPAAMLAAWLWRRPVRPAVFMVPLAGLAAWNAVLLARFGTLPAAERGDAFGMPLAGPAEFLRWYSSALGGPLRAAEFVFVVCVAVIGVRVAARGGMPLEHRLAVAAAAVVLLSLSATAWADQWSSFLRVGADMYMLTLVGLLGRRDIRLVGAGATLTAAVAAAQLHVLAV